MGFDLIVRRATLPHEVEERDIGVTGERIIAVEPRLDGEAGEEIDAGGLLVTPPFVDCHFHLDAALSLGIPRLNRSGTLLEGIAVWGELKPLLTHEAMADRALRYCDLAVSQGLHFERTAEDGIASVAALCELAANRGLMIDLHCDETDDPSSRHVETLAKHALRLRLGSRAAASHLTSMHSMDNYYASKLLPLIAESGINAIANPLINIVLQGRHDTYPKRRGLMRIKEMREHGVNIAFGHDCVMDPWYSLGQADMLEVAHMAVHAAQLTSLDEMAYCFDAITTRAAQVMHLPDYGIAPGHYADMVLLQAHDAVEAIRLKPARLAVIRRGKVIAKSAPAYTQLFLPERPSELHRTRYPST